MQEFTQAAQKVLGKSQEIMDKMGHGQWTVVHLAAALLDNPDARLKNLYKAKNAPLKEMRARVQNLLEGLAKFAEPSPDVSPDPDLSRVLRASVQLVRSEQGASAEPGHLLVALMKHSADKRVVALFEGALGNAEAVATWLSDPMSAAAVAQEESALNKYGRELVELCAQRLGWNKSTTYTVLRRLSEADNSIAEIRDAAARPGSRAWRRRRLGGSARPSSGGQPRWSVLATWISGTSPTARSTTRRRCEPASRHC